MLIKNKIILSFNEEQKNKLDLDLKKLWFLFVKLWDIKAINSWLLNYLVNYNKELLDKIDKNLNNLLDNQKCEYELIYLKSKINNDFKTFYEKIIFLNKAWLYFAQGWIYIKNKKIANIFQQSGRKILIKFDNFSNFENLNNLFLSKLKADLSKNIVSIEYREEETKLLKLLSEKSMSVYNIYRMKRKNDYYGVKIYKQLDFSSDKFLKFLYNKYKNKDDRILEELKKMM